MIGPGRKGSGSWWRSAFLGVAFVLAVAGCAGVTRSVAPSTSAPRTHEEVFETVWQTVNGTFPDPTFGGKDWAALHDRYAPLIAGATSEEEFYSTLNRMLWELGASHLVVIPSQPMFDLDRAYADGGVGVDVRMIDGEAVLTHVVASSPADRAGLRPGVILRAVDGFTVQQIEAADRGYSRPPYNGRSRRGSLASSVLLRTYGDPGTSVAIVYEDDQGEHRIDLARAQREGRSVLVEGFPPNFLEIESRRLVSDIGYVRFNAFDPALQERMLSAVDEQSDAAGLIIDLRGNPGGFFQVRKALVEQLISERVLFCRQEGRRGTEDIYLDPAPDAYDGQVVILVDEMSTSSSEEVAGGLQAIGRAIIVGTRTPGVALIAETTQLPGAMFVYPIAISRLADGTILEGRGVTPDIEVALDRDLLLQGRDSQLEAALAYLEQRVP